MARKTTKAARDAIKRFNDAREHADGILLVRETVPEENWTDHTHKWTPEFIDGYMAGFQMATEGILFDQGCWHGLYFTNAKGQHLLQGRYDNIEEHPEYRSWRVCFNHTE